MNNITCTIDSGTGALGGGIQLDNFLWRTKIKVPNGNGTSLIIRPSFVTAILTTSKLQTGVGTGTASTGIQVCVDLGEGKINGSTDPVCVMCDKRFQQLKSNLFTTILQDCDPVAEGDPALRP